MAAVIFALVYVLICLPLAAVILLILASGRV